MLKKTTHRIIKVKILGLKLIICFRIKETEIVVASKPRKLIVPTGPARIKNEIETWRKAGLNTTGTKRRSNNYSKKYQNR